jgi:hypothetical protein
MTRSDLRARHPSFRCGTPIFYREPLIPTLLERLGGWMADHVVISSVVFFGSAFLAGVMTGRVW